ncbi:MAG TPA: IclR family transcriptional regulator [Acidimicrobiales bacterium]|nr:IclR family transcriptional regulator [Acidimicrobiales bacterium]
MDSVSGIGVLDKAFAIVDALEAGPRSLNDLVATTGIARATTHRLAVALEAHGMVRRDDEGRFALGLRLLPLADLARPALERLRDETGESVQLYVRQGDARVCVLSLESPHGLRTIVPLGATLPLDRGSAGRVLRGDLGTRQWVESVEEREAGVASVSAPVFDAHGAVVAAVSVSGPVQRTTRSPGKKYGAACVSAARAVEAPTRPARR